MLRKLHPAPVKHPHTVRAVGDAHLGAGQKALPRGLAHVKGIETCGLADAAMSFITGFAVDHGAFDGIGGELLGKEIGPVLARGAVARLVHVEVDDIHKGARQISLRRQMHGDERLRTGRLDRLQRSHVIGFFIGRFETGVAADKEDGVKLFEALGDIGCVRLDGLQRHGRGNRAPCEQRVPGT